MVSEMSTAGFAGTEMQLRHVYRERDLAELLSAMQFLERDPQTPKARGDHLCFVTVRGVKPSTAHIETTV